MVFAHLVGLVYGIATALISTAAFYATGALLLSRWLTSSRWPDRIMFGLTFYVCVCWVATSARNIPVLYVALLLGAGLWSVAALRFQRVRATVAGQLRNPETRLWLLGFSVLYVFAYLLVWPPAGASFLTLPPDGARDLVTYARYAKHLLAFGTADVDLAAFDYLHSPASAFLLAWHSLLFLGDPLDAGMPLIFMLSALFGMIAVDLARSLFGLSWRAAMAIAAIATCAPMFRWTLSTYSLGELVSAMSVLYLATVFGRAAVMRSLAGAHIVGLAAGSTLLFFGPWPLDGVLSSLTRAVVEAGRHFSLLALFGFPGRIPLTARTRDSLSSAALAMLPLVPLVWAAAAWRLRRTGALGRVAVSDVDRQLASALVVYMAVAVIVGNVAVHTVRGAAPVRRPGAWRELSQIGRMPFRAFTLKVAGEPNGLSTALALYYVAGRKTDVIGRSVSLDELPVENISRQQPMFIQNLGCEAAGHGDVVSVPRIGCLLMAPPSMIVGTSYPFNQTFLFVDFDRMTAREPGGRWNTESRLNLGLTADPQRANLDRQLFVNLLVNPFLPPGVKPQTLVLQWGRQRRGHVSVAERQWLSLPVGSNDWAGNRMWTVPIVIDFPDGRTILFHEVALTDSPRGQLVEMIQAGA